jgi:YidC/Oxa1 family membrane protein insertase
MQDENRNLFTFAAVAMVLFVGYYFLVMGPQTQLREAEARKAAAAQKAQAAKGPDATPPVVALSRAEALKQSPRVPIVSDTLTGSISLNGGLFDDLFLKKYNVAVNDTTPVELLRPFGAKNSWYAEFGWFTRDQAGESVPLLDSRTVWQHQSGDVLAPGKPVVLTYSSPQGLVVTRTLTLDDRYMFTVTDTVMNKGAAPLDIAPYSRVTRWGLPDDLHKNQYAHVGAVGMFGKAGHYELSMLKYFDPWKKEKNVDVLHHTSTGGWIGLTDKYWLTALAPPQTETVQGDYIYKAKDDTYRGDLTGQARALPVGMQITETTQFFAGAKTREVLSGYQKGYPAGAAGLPRFEDAVDWGKLFMLTKPFFSVLDFIFKLVGNFGVAILIMTVLVRLLLFPLANKSYESMSKMRKLQEPMKEIKEKYKDDPTKQQQETMALYQREKVNPMVGCLPILVQIPVFLAFFKVLSTTIEMRHAPFYGWIQDLSARDSTTIWNLFGLIPWNPSSLDFGPLGGHILDGNLHLGVLALLYGFTMWLTTSMNPPAPDPMQQRMFQLMPLIFTFIMTGYPVGLLLYWTWSNVLSILQQYVIMHRLEVDNPIDDFINRIRGKNQAAPG